MGLNVRELERVGLCDRLGVKVTVSLADSDGESDGVACAPRMTNTMQKTKASRVWKRPDMAVLWDPGAAPHKALGCTRRRNLCMG